MTFAIVLLIGKAWFTWILNAVVITLVGGSIYGIMMLLRKFLKKNSADEEK